MLIRLVTTDKNTHWVNPEHIMRISPETGKDRYYVVFTDGAYISIGDDEQNRILRIINNDN